MRRVGRGGDQENSIFLSDRQKSKGFLEPTVG